MKALIVGYGSMGRRRIRNLRQINQTIKISCLEKKTERQIEAKKDGIEVIRDLDKCIDIDMAFICSPPPTHCELAKKMIGRGIKNVFLEINMSADGYNELLEEAKRNNAKIFMSSTQLYRRQIRYICDEIRKYGKPVSYNYHVGQYLPDWHPWENYKNFFVGDKETNGVREIFAAQLPWIIQAFGKIDTVTSNRTRLSDLDISYSDCIIASIRHDNRNIGVFSADVVSRVPINRIEIIGEGIYISWGGHNNDLLVYDIENREKKYVKLYEDDQHIDGYADNINENQYVDEVRAFLSTVENDETPIYSLYDDRNVLSIIDKIEYE